MLHPKEILSTQIIEKLREEIFISEERKCLSARTLDIIYREKWLQILVPKVCGGMEYSLPQAVQLFEALAYVDGNVGWCVNLGAGANMFSGYLEQQTACKIFNNAETWCAGSGASSGKAKETEGGYLLSGRWKYASGANHASHFTANAFLLDKDGKEKLKDGQPEFRSFMVPANNIINYKNWYAVGLKATSSNDFEAVDVFVPYESTFTLLKPSDFATGIVYQFPFGLLAEVNMACMLTGLALHFEEAYRTLAINKKPLHASTTLAENPKAKAISMKASERFHAGRTNMHQQLNALWHLYEYDEIVDETAVQQFKDANKEAVAASRNLIQELFPLCGLNIVDPQSELNKIWRDAAVAGQHYLLSPLY